MTSFCFSFFKKKLSFRVEYIIIRIKRSDDLSTSAFLSRSVLIILLEHIIIINKSKNPLEIKNLVTYTRVCIMFTFLRFIIVSEFKERK